jgi:acetate kinase
MHGGRSAGTTMSFTALDGPLMGTRPGTLDPGAVTYLMRERAMSAAEIEDVLYHRSLRRIRDFERHAYAAVQQSSACARSLLGKSWPRVHGGNRRALLRNTGRICARCSWLGVILDENANRAGSMRIAAESSRIRVYVIPTDEEKIIAQHTVTLIDIRRTK